MIKCCFCGKDIKYYGNDIRPINTSKGDRCCDACNLSIVISTRRCIWEIDSENAVLKQNNEEIKKCLQIVIDKLDKVKNDLTKKQ